MGHLVARDVRGFVVYLVAKARSVDNCQRNARSLLVEFELYCVLAKLLQATPELFSAAYQR